MNGEMRHHLRAREYRRSWFRLLWWTMTFISVSLEWWVRFGEYTWLLDYLCNEMFNAWMWHFILHTILWWFKKYCNHSCAVCIYFEHITHILHHVRNYFVWVNTIRCVQHKGWNARLSLDQFITVILHHQFWHQYWYSKRMWTVDSFTFPILYTFHPSCNYLFISVMLHNLR